MRAQDDAMRWMPPSGDREGREHPVVDGRGQAPEAEQQAEAPPAEMVLDEVRVACRHVRDAWRELWR
jgi:hypothetical protein